jgi:hypothetical protein
MWILKGTLLGLWLSGFGTIAYLYLAIFRYMPLGSMINVTFLPHRTIQNPLWWVALVVCFVLSYAIARSWAGPTILWVGLLVTGLVPAGLLALYITMAVKLKQAAQGHP